MTRVSIILRKSRSRRWIAGSSPIKSGTGAPAMTVEAKYRTSIRPGERDLVERLRPEFLRGPRHHPPAEGAVEFGRMFVVGERPDHHALQAALHQVALGGGEKPAAEAEALKLGAQIELVDLAFEMQAARAVAAVIGIARALVAEHQHADAAALADRAVPPLRAAAVDQLLQLGAGNDALIGVTPGFIMGRGHRGCVRSFGRSNLDQGCAHGCNQSKSARPLQGLSLIIG